MVDKMEMDKDLNIKIQNFIFPYAKEVFLKKSSYKTFYFTGKILRNNDFYIIDFLDVTMLRIENVLLITVSSDYFMFEYVFKI